jgi:hypothetical protein
MAVFGQGAPGVRIQLRDESQIDLVTQPIVTGGVVGFSSRGELNKIIDITSTADMDVILGPGFNNPQFNQGLYAARAVVQSGGFVEFVRPYGEEIILDDNDPEYSYNQKLKTDTYLVEYNFTTPDDPSIENIPDSFATTYMASTRYIQDLLAGMGEREVHTISETISKNTNINFYLDADETIVDDVDTVSLFAIMNSDPTAARRAGDRFDISSIQMSNPTGAVIQVVSKNNHGFTVGETVYVTGTSQYNGAFQVSSIDGAKKFSFVDVDKNGGTTLPETDGAIYINADTVQSGVDYLEVKTAARGKSSKKLGTFILEDIPLDIVAGQANTTGLDTVVTITGTIPTSLEDGDSVSIEGATTTSLNGVFVVENVVAGVSFDIVLDIAVSVTAEDMFFAELGNQLFTTLLADGTEVLSEYVVDGQSPLSVANDNEVGPVGVTVVKSEVGLAVLDTFDNTDVGITADTFDSAATATDEIQVATIANYSIGDEVVVAAGAGTLPTGLTAGTYVVATVSVSSITLDGVTITGAGVGTCDISVIESYIIPTTNTPLSVGDRVDIAAGTGTLPTGLTAGQKVVAEVNGTQIKLFESDGTTPVVITANGVGVSLLIM